MERLESRDLLAQTVGLTLNTSDAYAGYTLFAPSAATTTYLIDNQGERVNSWESDFPPMSAYLLPDGGLLRTARLPNTANTLNAPGAAGRIELFDWEGELVWEYELNTPDQRLHHDIELMPNGNILMIAWKRYTRAEALQAGRDPNLQTDNGGEVWPDTILELQPDYAAGVGGTIVWEWNLWDHLVQDRFPGRNNYGSVAGNPQRVDINYLSTGTGAGGILADWTHFNAVDYNPALDQIIVSSREFNEFWIIDHSTTPDEARGSAGGNGGRGGDLLYRWGNAEAYDRAGGGAQELFYQHDAQWIEEGLPGAGNILVFNNGWNRLGGANYSSIVEVVPPNNEQWLLNNRTDGSISNVVVYGAQQPPVSWQPIVGDWNGDHVDTTGYYDPDLNQWHLNNSVDAWDTRGEIVFSGPLGAGAGWIPLAGDWNGDGVDTVGLYNPQQQQWRLSNASGAWEEELLFSVPGSQAGWLPIAGDWNGDRVDTPGLYDPDSNDWLLSNAVGAWGETTLLAAPVDVPATWRPIAGDWNRNGFDTVGLYDPQNHRWYLNNRIDGSIADLIVVNAPQAPRDSQPLSGDWNGDGYDTIGLYDASHYAIYPNAPYAPADPVWTYTGSPRSSFFATIISGAQRLPNGNTLINEGTEGRFFEVTPDGRIVWQYVNPVITGNVILNHDQAVPAANIGIPGVDQNFVFRAYRYGLDYLDSNLDVTPQGPLERYPVGRDAVGYYDPNASAWTLNARLDNSPSALIQFSDGQPANRDALPISGDWNGDGLDSVGSYDPHSLTFRLVTQVTNPTATPTVVVAASPELNEGWLPVAGDWDNDGVDTVGLYDPVTNDWLLNNDPLAWNNPQRLPAPADVPSWWIPIAGDWDGKGGDGVGLYDPVSNNWYLNNRIDGGLDLTVLLAPVDVPAEWLPVAGDWNNNGMDTVGLYDPTRRRWYLNNRVDGSVSDLIIVSTPDAPVGAIPVAGSWSGLFSTQLAQFDDGSQYLQETLLAGWQRHFGDLSTVVGAPLSPDLDANGLVDGGDFLEWQRGGYLGQFGDVSTNDVPTARAASGPDPTSDSMLGEEDGAGTRVRQVQRRRQRFDLSPLDRAFAAL